MGRPKQMHLCVHCLKPIQRPTDDHVFPRSWYPDTTPTNLEKWRIPCCSDCNAKYGALEDDLLFRLGMCVSPEEAKSAGISEKALRSIQPSAAKNERDRRCRERKRERIRKELIQMEDIPKEGLLPNFGPQPGQESGPYLGVLVSKSKLEALGTKIVRGITYLRTGSTLGTEYRIPIFFGDETNAIPVIELLKHHGQVYGCGPGISVHLAQAHDDPLTAVYRIEIWGKLRIYAAVHQRDFMDHPSESFGQSQPIS
jgi:hypothetical protein